MLQYRRMSKHMSSERSPFHIPYGESIGSGKDNRVVTLLYPGVGDRVFPKERASKLPKHIGEQVVKLSNENPRGNYLTSEAALDDAKYKKAKYEMIRKFLGDFVPKSSFLVGERVDSMGKRIVKSMTVQERVPQLTLADLTKEERNSDGLRGQMYTLVSRLQVMHRVLDRASGIVESNGGEFIVEDSLDLGPLSNYVRQHVDDNADTFNYKEIINGFKASPNLLVDPVTMQLSCVDFGSGQWSEDMGLQMGVINDIVEHDPGLQHLG